MMYSFILSYCVLKFSSKPFSLVKCYSYIQCNILRRIKSFKFFLVFACYSIGKYIISENPLTIHHNTSIEKATTNEMIKYSHESNNNNVQVNLFHGKHTFS